MRRHSLTGFRQGDHVCGLYETPEEQLVTASRFIGDGLRHGERCVYAAAAIDGVSALRARLRDGGIDVPYEEERRSLVLITGDQSWQSGGQFHPERMVRLLNAGLEQALEDGYVGFRTCGDMSWLQDGATGPVVVSDYEARCTEFFRSVRGLCMCLYDRRLPSPLLHAALATHPSLFLDGLHRRNPFFATSSGPADDPSEAALQRKLETLRPADA